MKFIPKKKSLLAALSMVMMLGASSQVQSFEGLISPASDFSTAGLATSAQVALILTEIGTPADHPTPGGTVFGDINYLINVLGTFPPGGLGTLSAQLTKVLRQEDCALPTYPTTLGAGVRGLTAGLGTAGDAAVDLTAGRGSPFAGLIYVTRVLNALKVLVLQEAA